MEVKHPCQHVDVDAGKACGRQSDGRTIIDGKTGKRRRKEEHRCVEHMDSQQGTA